MSLEQQRNKNHVWSEKYRPSQLNQVVLNEVNQRLLDNIVASGNFPNLLLFGPPGTGKTTTIFNLIRAYQEKHEKVSRELIIHLNASDDRGIDVIRNQIHQFAHSKGLFVHGTKFVVLDEADSTTPQAQHALKYLMQACLCNPAQKVRFCLICNYLCKIQPQLQSQFVCLKYDQLDPMRVHEMLCEIVEKEQLEDAWTEEQMWAVQEQYGSDVRSMINAIQYTSHLFQETSRVQLREKFRGRWEAWAQEVAKADTNVAEQTEAWAQEGEAMVRAARPSISLVEMVQNCISDWLRAPLASIPVFLKAPDGSGNHALCAFFEKVRAKMDRINAEANEGSGHGCVWQDETVVREWKALLHALSTSVRIAVMP